MHNSARLLESSICNNVFTFHCIRIKCIRWRLTTKRYVQMMLEA
jgi:hypothetical protein